MSRRRPTPRLTSKQRLRANQRPVKYHLMVVDAFWPQHFPDWGTWSREQKMDARIGFANQVNDFLQRRGNKPSERVALIMTNQMVRMVPLYDDALLTVHPLYNAPERVVMTAIAAHPGAPSPGEGIGCGPENKNNDRT